MVLANSGERNARREYPDPDRGSDLATTAIEHRIALDMAVSVGGQPEVRKWKLASRLRIASAPNALRR
jgi:hypothetical protein